MEQLIRCKTLYDSLKSKVSFLDGKRQTLLSQLKEKEETKKELEKEVALLLQCIDIFKHLGESVQKKVILGIETFVTRIYQFIFQSNERFKIKYEIKRNVPNMRFVLLDSSHIEYDPVDSLGGGVVDVLSFAIRLVVLMHFRPKMRQVLILDEPFKHLSVQYRPRVLELLKILSRDCGVQLIITTHQEEFMNMDSVSEISNVRGESKCVRKDID